MSVKPQRDYEEVYSAGDIPELSKLPSGISSSTLPLLPLRSGAGQTSVSVSKR